MGVFQVCGVMIESGSRFGAVGTVWMRAAVILPDFVLALKNCTPAHLPAAGPVMPEVRMATVVSLECEETGSEPAPLPLSLRVLFAFLSPAGAGRRYRAKRSER